MKLFSLIAGESSHTFAIDGIEFKAAPLTLAEQEGYYAAAKGGPDTDLMDVMADRLRVRIVGVNEEHRTRVTGEWLAANVTTPGLTIIIDILLNGAHEKKALEERVQGLLSQKKS